MTTLSPEGRRLVDSLAQNYGFSSDAVETLLRAVSAGGGTQAQFNHYEFGGMGQWSQGGMIMIGDMFNNGLKDRVSRLANELSNAIGQSSPFAPMASQSQSQSQGGGYGTSYGSGSQSSLFVTSPGSGNWWPENLGQPSSTGAQNTMRYAVFPGARRLAIQDNGAVTVYDTGEHQIGGVGQQQGGGQSFTFSSQFGLVRVSDLPLVDTARPAKTQTHPVPDQSPAVPMMPAEASVTPKESREDVFAALEKLHDFQTKGILTADEYAKKKQELLSRI